MVESVISQFEQKNRHRSNLSANDAAYVNKYLSIEAD